MAAAHVLHKAYGTILVLYRNVNKLADKVKKLFMKPPAMIELFKINVPDTGSPERTQ
jgi:hypothetical protein